MPANSRDTQGPQNKDKASLTPHRDELTGKSGQGGPKPGSQERPRQENEVSARERVGMGAPQGPGPSSPGGSDLVSRQTHLHVQRVVQGGSHQSLRLWKGRTWAGHLPWDSGDMQLETKNCANHAQCCRSSDFSLCQHRCRLLANGTFLLLPTKLIFFVFFPCKKHWFISSNTL